MPELPEVETIKRILTPQLVGQEFSLPIIYLTKAIKSPIDEYISHIQNQKVTSLERKGKTLLIHLTNGYYILFHLRMEGKLYVVSKENYEKKHLTLFLPFSCSTKGLAFYDTRKFGISLCAKDDDKTPLLKIGPDPFEIDNASVFYQKYHQSNRMIKELLLDQSILSGIGNIYANEILYKSRISPFKKGYDLSMDECQTILCHSKEILSLAIQSNGSTIRTYHASQDVSGAFQSHLKVYAKKGTPCEICSHKIEKAFVDHRGTEYCPHCQKTGINIAITGKIASGKSLATSYFKDCGFLTFSADSYVHQLYDNRSFIRVLKKEFPFIFTPELNKDEITKRLQNDKGFKRKYLGLIYKKVREEINRIIINNDNTNKAFEIPVLFDAHMDDMFQIIIGVETTKQKEHLLERGDDPKKALFNKMNSYDTHKDKITYILHTDGTKEELKKQVIEVINKISR